ncbi:PD-(D/E)XK motif protein [Dyadobacter chenhuakuii]|uniref:PD-(D/E)XK motif protein n=1 Tax=Dyadobacter chenhuakuii TaxID=2909339 RepID=A0A9X1QJC4_9BACT|nr:PD-(D/E)XK motif protein [Dyadobacter chenhuakuii]MCF2501362.1 PD-(D/E)XK motif protein [Dyadobacter chenhuakuii]
MKIQDISQKWLLMNPPSGNAYTSVRIDSTSLPGIFLGLNRESKRCLILKLPKGYNPDFQSSVKQNLSLSLYAESGWVVLTLLDDNFHDLFDDLIFSIYIKIHSMSSARIYVTELLKTYYKWSEFFRDTHNQSLADETVRGLFGELTVLNEMLLESTSADINDVLKSWKGPYDTNHDFVNETCDKEVKTRLESILNITIASEHQLQADIGKNLELVIVTLVSDTVNGLSLPDLVITIRDIVMSKLGDYTIVLDGLSQKGLNVSSLQAYKDLRFVLVKISSYDCCQVEFPKIVRSNIAAAVSSVSYKLNVEELKPFILSETLFNGNK